MAQLNLVSLRFCLLFSFLYKSVRKILNIVEFIIEQLSVWFDNLQLFTALSSASLVPSSLKAPLSIGCNIVNNAFRQEKQG